MSRREEILEKVKAVPAMPASALKVTQLLRDPGLSFSNLAKAIEFDAGLTSNFLRVANSAYYAGAWSVSSVREAVVRLGTNTVLQLVVEGAIAPMVQQPIKGYDLPPGQLWEHSVGVAFCVGLLATALKIKVPNHTFTAALLHDIGKMALGTFVEIDAGPILELVEKEKVSFPVAEQRILGIDHCEAGAAMLESWSIPPCIVDVARWHHSPQECRKDCEVVELVHIADALCLMAGLGMGTDGLNYSVSDDIATRLGLTPQIAEGAVCGTMAKLEKMRGLFALSNGRSGE
jgi:putative nucleotidyltransferase with HDIG domain